jgi:acylphosphatase
MSNNMKVAVQILVKGMVQGVGFRYFAMRQANQLGVTGYVKNLVSGDVEIVVEGEREIVDHFKRILKEGPSYGIVEDLVVKELPYENKYSRFSVEF